MADITVDQFVEDLEVLCVTFGFEKLSLVGHSWGVIVALSYAVKYPSHLDRLILADSIPVHQPFFVELGEAIQQRTVGLSA